MIIFRHYLKRIITEPITMLIFILFPAVLVAVNTFINLGMVEDEMANIVNGRDMMAGSVAVLMLIMFQFMGGTLVIDHIFRDLKSDRRWRLGAAPVSGGKIVFSMALANIVFSIIAGLLVLAVGFIFFNAYYPNILVLLALLVILAVFSAFLGMLVSAFVPKKGTAEAIIMIFAWGMILPAGLFGPVNLGSALNRFFEYFTPYAMALRTTLYSGMPRDDMGIVMLNLGLLAGLTVLLAIATLILSRRRESV